MHRLSRRSVDTILRTGGSRFGSVSPSISTSHHLVKTNHFHHSFLPVIQSISFLYFITSINQYLEMPHLINLIILFIVIALTSLSFLSLFTETPIFFPSNVMIHVKCTFFKNLFHIH